jgi:peptide/nickel transport system substrate-binding protein
MKKSINGISRRSFMAVAAGSGLLFADVAGRAQSGDANAPQPKRGGRLRVGLNAGSAKDSLNAKAALTEADIARQNNLYETLLYFDPDYRIQPCLAASVEASEGATLWTIRLRSGVTFHSGKPLTAKDVAFTLQYVLDPKSPGAAASRLSLLDAKGTEIIDDLTLRLRFKTPYAVFPDIAADRGTAGLRIVPEGYDPTKPVGTGPFKAQSFEPGVRSVFVRNENYWRESQPYLDELELIDFTDDAARVNALLSGQIDAVANLPSSQIRVIEANPDFKVIVSETGAWNPFTMRIDTPPFDDVRVRQAFRLMINREQMIQQVLSRQGAKGNDLFGRFDPGYAADLPQREVDIDQTKSLLKRAGHEGLAMELVTSPVSIGLVPAAEAFVQQASLAGVKLTLRQMEPSAFFSQSFLVSPFSQSYWATRNYLLQTADCMLPGAPYNETHWANEKWLKIVLEGFAQVDDVKRAELIHAAQEIEYEEGGYINWGFQNKVDAVRSNVKGLVPDRCGLSLTSFGFRHAWLAS